MTAPQGHTLLIRAQDKIGAARWSVHGLLLIGQGLVIVDRNAANAIVDLAGVALKRLDKAERKIERYRQREREGASKPTQAAI
ncbi:MAG: hypothetical protein WAV02_17600 [Stellaceae bacterium]